MLGRLRMSVSEAIAEYLELSKIVFAPKHRYNVFARLRNTATARGRCDSKVLEEQVQKVVGKYLGEGKEQSLLLEEDPSCRSFVCALNASKRSLVRFRNYELEGYSDLQPKIWQAARATSAAPTFFDPVKIGNFNEHFVDGGAGYNCPIREVHKEAQTVWAKPRRDFQYIISIGTGKSSLKPFGKSLVEIGKTLIAIATDADQTAAQFGKDHPEMMGKGAERRLFRFQVQHGLENVGMAEHEKIDEIASATRIYMEEEELEGYLQLKLFKALASSQCDYVLFKSTSVPLPPDQVRYIEKNMVALGFRAPAMILPSGKPDFSCGTIKLPKTLFDIPTHHAYHHEQMVARSEKFASAPNQPAWRYILGRYSVDPEKNLLMKELPVHEATWCSDYGGLFAVEIPVVDVWRIIGSYNRHFRNSEDRLRSENEIHVQDLWISVPGALHGKPLVRMVFREGSILPDHELRIPSRAYAAAMCGLSQLSPDTVGGRRLFSSAAPYWETIKVPLVLAFTLLPIENRCFFEEQYRWVVERIAAMVKVNEALWDHADAIDLDDHDVPIKVRLRELAATKFLKDVDINQAQNANHYTTDSRFERLNDLAQRQLRTWEDFCEGGDSIELEDAVFLLERSNTYAPTDFRALNEDGETEVLRDWWGRFGEERARWIALAMTAKLLLNMCQSFTLPATFSSLLHQPSSTVFLV
ncbi:hypothetical protein LTR84_005952 [Exophiala bonariae]|uniref:PNPLA domain-containing protein n=1 Tax=Exophiala bonariae TaxID=1690606 RepID=A0AAV9N380_9EURO|nr:hypothetical protein LTR84_005952 [Exophiala bonariae]